MIDGQNVFESAIKNNFRTYASTQEIITGQGDDYTNYCLLNYNYFKKIIRW